MEGNMCWNCKHIATCRPRVRPQCSCSGYESLGKPITQRELASRVGLSYKNFRYRLWYYGLDEMLEFLDSCGEDIRYEQGKSQIKFYDLSNGEKELCESV